MVDPGPERGDQLQGRTRRGQHLGVDSVGDRRHQNIGLSDRGDQLGFAKGCVVEVEPAGEKLHHPGLDRVRKLAGDDHEWPFRPHGDDVRRGRGPPLARGGVGCPGGRAARGLRRACSGAAGRCFVVGAPLAAAAESEAGQKLPRFVSLRSDQVNLRVGPGENYPIEWVLTRKEMPVEIVREFENWRMIRDWQGTEGWVHERMLTGKRAVVVKGGIRTLASPARSGVAGRRPRRTRRRRAAARMPRRLVPHRRRRSYRLGPARRPLGRLSRRNRAVIRHPRGNAVTEM